MRFFLISASFLVLSACSTGLPIERYNAAPAAPEAFMLCHGYSCTYQTPTGFTDKEWGQIGALFKRPAKDATEERTKIAQAIALMERISGGKTGTDIDAGEATTRKSSIKQLDCIDETINTTHYLRFITKAGFLKFHEAHLPAHRGYIVDGTWPHNTAVMREKKTGALWAVDSFYRKNGEDPYIVPRADWVAGWKPPGARQ